MNTLFIFLQLNLIILFSTESACSSLNRNQLILFIKMKILEACIDRDVSAMHNSNNCIFLSHDYGPEF